MESVHIEEGRTGWKGRRCNMWVLVAILFVLALIGAAVVLTLYIVFYTVEQYGIVFDAGSTHSDMTLYRWPGAKLRGTGEVIEVTRCDVKDDGISDYQYDWKGKPEDAGPTLKDCLNHGANKVPANVKKVTPVYLGATAGMRLVEPSKADRIMQSIGKVFGESGLKYSDGHARIISDQEEGMYAWITANLLLEQLGQLGDKIETSGVLDMGGASTQIAFETSDRASNPVSADYGQLRLYGFDFPVFAHSYLCWGSKEATARHRSIILNKNNNAQNVEDPCLNKGHVEAVPVEEAFGTKCTRPAPDGLNIKNFTFTGTSNFEQCQALVDEQLDTEKCTKLFGSNCFDKSVIPTIKGRFVAMSSYWYVASFLSIEKVSLQKYSDGIKKFCQLPIEEVAKMKGQTLKFSKGHCYNAVLQHQILRTVYGFNDEEAWKRLSFERQIKGVTTGWALGFMANATNIIPTEKVRTVQVEVFVVLLVVFLLVAIVVGVCSFRVWQRNKSRSSQISHAAREPNCYGLCCPRK